MLDNLDKITSKWYGFGSGPSGNKAVFTFFTPDNAGANPKGWFEGLGGHTNNTVSMLTNVAISTAPSNFRNNVRNIIDENGFIHCLAHAEPSDGVTPSKINTDYVELVIELKSTAQLDTRPTLMRVADFNGKVSGSTEENPHIARSVTGKKDLALFTDGSEFSQSSTGYNEIRSLDGANKGLSQTVSDVMAQHLFSFDLIEEIERNLGRIPRSTVVDKVAWIRR